MNEQPQEERMRVHARFSEIIGKNAIYTLEGGPQYPMSLDVYDSNDRPNEIIVETDGTKTYGFSLPSSSNLVSV